MVTKNIFLKKYYVKKKKEQIFPKKQHFIGITKQKPSNLRL